MGRLVRSTTETTSDVKATSGNLIPINEEESKVEETTLPKKTKVESEDTQTTFEEDVQEDVNRGSKLFNSTTTNPILNKYRKKSNEFGNGEAEGNLGSSSISTGIAGNGQSQGININATDTSKMDSTAKNTILAYNINAKGQNEKTATDRSGLFDRIADIGYNAGQGILDNNQSTPTITVSDNTNTIDRMNELSNKVTWTSAEKNEAKAILNLYKNPQQILGKYYENNPQGLSDAMNTYNRLFNKYHNVGTKATENVAKATGILPVAEAIVEGIDNLTDNKYNLTDSVDELNSELIRKNRYQYNNQEDTWGGSVNSNVAVGRLGQDESLAWNNYLDNPTAENLKYAQDLSAYKEDYITNNTDAINHGSDKDGIVGTVDKVTRTIANYLPQLVDQSIAGGPGTLVTMLTGNRILGNALSAIGSGKYSYQTMRGAAYKGLIDNGVDEEVARIAASDESLISSIIESADTFVGLMMFMPKGIGALMGKDTVELASKAIAQGTSKSAIAKALTAALKYGLGVLKETAEEETQESVSIANEERSANGLNNDEYLKLFGQNTINLDLLKESASEFANFFKTRSDDIDEAILKKVNKNQELTAEEQAEYERYQKNERIKEAGEGGGIIGAFMSAIGLGVDAGVNSVAKNYAYTKQGQTIQNNETAFNGTINYGLNSDKDSEAYQQASSIRDAINRGETPKASEVGQMFYSVYSQMEDDAMTDARDSVNTIKENISNVTDDLVSAVASSNEMMQALAEETGVSYSDKLPSKVKTFLARKMLHTVTKNNTNTNVTYDVYSKLGLDKSRFDAKTTMNQNVRQKAVDAVNSINLMKSQNINGNKYTTDVKLKLNFTKSILESAIQSDDVDAKSKIAYASVINKINDALNGKTSQEPRNIYKKIHATDTRVQGKKIGNTEVFHRSMVQSSQWLKKNAPNDSYSLISVNKEEGYIDYITVDDFDGSTEPLITNITRVSSDGVYDVTPKEATIIINRGELVPSNYKGFDVKQALARQSEWQSAAKTDRTLSYNPQTINLKKNFDDLMSRMDAKNPKVDETVTEEYTTNKEDNTNGTEQTGAEVSRGDGRPANESNGESVRESEQDSNSRTTSRSSEEIKGDSSKAESTNPSNTQSFAGEIKCSELFKGGSEDKNVTVLSDEELSPNQIKQKKAFAKRGISLFFVKEKLFKANGNTASGYSDGNKIVVSLDSRWKWHQILAHEDLHSRIAKSPINPGTGVHTLLENIVYALDPKSRETLDAMVDVYADAYAKKGEVIGYWECAEEVLCNANGKMNLLGHVFNMPNYLAEEMYRPLIREFVAADNLYAKTKNNEIESSTPKNAMEELFSSAGVGFTEKDKNGLIHLTIDGKEVKEVSGAYIKEESPLGLMIQLGAMTQGKDNVNIDEQCQAVATLINMISKTQNPELIWELTGSQLFSPFKSNSDSQYSTTIDMTTICRKTQEMINAMSAAMIEKGRGLSKEGVIELQSKLIEAGHQVPCPVCFVFSRWAGIGSRLDRVISLQEKYKDYSNAKLREQFKEVEEKYLKINGKNISAKDRYKQADKFESELEAEWSKLNDDIARQELFPQTNRGKELLATRKARLAEIQKKVDICREYSWFKDVRLQDDYKPIPADVLLDIGNTIIHEDKGNRDSVTILAEDYPNLFKWKKKGGPNAGKAIVPFAAWDFGTFFVADESEKSKVGSVAKRFVKKFQGIGAQLDSENPELTSQQKSFLRNKINAVKAQNFLGGQRYQSTSDFRFDYSIDYIQSFYELQALGSYLHTYTKVPEYAELIARIGGDVNLSIMPKGIGYEGDKLVFSSITGLDYKAALSIVNKHDNAQLILVGVNRKHMELAMDDDGEGRDITFIIPFHASGASAEEFTKFLIEQLGEKYEEKGYVDYSPYKNNWENSSATEVQKARATLRENILTRLNVRGKNKWTPTAKDLELIKGKSKDITKMSFEELLAIEDRALAGDKKAIAEYSSWSAGVLADLYKRFAEGDMKDVHLTDKQAERLMPSEYWNKNTKREFGKGKTNNAYVNGFIYRSYCYNLGYHPIFTGMVESGAYKEDGDFRRNKGYWKTLPDRSMYALNGAYRDQTPVNLNGLSTRINNSKDITETPIHPQSAQGKEWSYASPKMPDELGAIEVGKEYAKNSDKFYGDGKISTDIADGIDETTRINNSMSMKQAEHMLKSVWNLFGKGTVNPNYDKWLAETDNDTIELLIESNHNLYKKYVLNNSALKDIESPIVKIMESYRNGTLVGNNKPYVSSIDLYRDRGITEDYFYAPQDTYRLIDSIDRDTWATADTRVTKNNRAEVTEARKKILFASHYAINDRTFGTMTAEDYLGVTPQGLNQKLSSWSNYPAYARNLSKKLNEDVGDSNKWTGLENSSALNAADITDEDIKALVKDIKGASTGEARYYIGKSMLALDTHINWSGLTFNFLDTPINDSSTVLGTYSRINETITVGSNKEQDTVAHEMGHALGHIWGRELTGHDEDLSVVSPNYKAYCKTKNSQAFFDHFMKFMDNITYSNDVNSEYTQSPNETFARFVAKFIDWTQGTAGARQFGENRWYRDKFTTDQFKDFVKLLQEKAALDTSYQVQSHTNPDLLPLYDIDEISPRFKTKSAPKEPLSLDGVSFSTDLEEILGNDYLSKDGKVATFTDERIDREIKDNYYGKTDGKEKTRAYVAFVNPVDFVKATTSDYDGFVSHEKNQGRMRELNEEDLRKQTQTPHFTVEFNNIDGQKAEITGHEGRHRMQALAEAGFTKAAILIDDPSRRYQTGRTSIDKVRLLGQEFNNGRGQDIYVTDVTPLFEENRDYIKSHFGSDGDIRYSTDLDSKELAPTFYSKMEKTIEEMKQPKISAAGVIPYLKGKGVKQDEIDSVNLADWLSDKKSVSKEDLLKYVKDNAFELTESTLYGSDKYKLDTSPEAYEEDQAKWIAEHGNAYKDAITGDSYDNYEDWEEDTRYRLEDEEINWYDVEIEDWDDYFVATYDGEEVARLEVDKDNAFPDYQEWAEDRRYYSENPQVETARWEGYKLDGGENYREIKFNVPNSNYSNQAMQVHWNKPGVLMHVRLQDFDMPDGKMLFMEEAQSDWHNEGRSKGYKGSGLSTSDFTRKINKLHDKFEAENKLRGLWERFVDNGYDETGLANIQANLIERPGETDAIVDRLGKHGIAVTKEETDTIKEYASEFEKLYAGFQTSKPNTTPNAPYKDTYTDYIVKRMLRMAAEDGYDYLGWTTAKQQDYRWRDGGVHDEGEGQSGYLKAYTIEYDQDIPKLLNKMGKPYGVKVEKIELDGSQAETISYEDGNGNKFESLRDWYDDVMASYGIDFVLGETKLFQDGYTWRIQDTATGEVLPEYLEASHEFNNVWSFKIPKELKDKVLTEGQPKFSTDLDTEYLNLAKDPEKNESKLRKMVEDAAKNAGYTKGVWHGTKAKFTKFALPSDQLGIHLGTKGQARTFAGRGKNAVMMNLYTKLGNTIELDRDLGSWYPDYVTKELYNKGILSQEEAEKILFTSDKKYKRSDSSAIKDLRTMLTEKGYNSISYPNWYEGKNTQTSYLIWDKNLAKSSDPVTYDNDGNVIPISERFDSSNPDIRFSTDLTFTKKPTADEVKDYEWGVFINDSVQPYTEQILNGTKTIESRTTKSLDPFVGKKVGLVRSGKGDSQVVGSVKFGNAKEYTSLAEFDADKDLHQVKYGELYDKYKDIFKNGGTVYGYPIESKSSAKAQPIKAEYPRYGRTAVKFDDGKPKAKLGTNFSGMGTYENAIRSIVQSQYAVEFDKKIAEVYKMNNSGTMYNMPIQDFVKGANEYLVDIIHGSPVCHDFSKAKTRPVTAEEEALDYETAKALAYQLEQKKPKVFTVENVKGYQNSGPVKLIKATLNHLGYGWDEVTLKASDYGAATTRERYFIRAMRDVAKEDLPPLPSKTEAKSWYEVVGDMIDGLKTLPRTSDNRSQAVAMPSWIEKRLDNMGIDWENVDEPLFVMYGKPDGKSMVTATINEPLPTITANSTDARIILPGGVVKQVSPEMFARITGLTDDIKLPKERTRAIQVIGNGIPPTLTEAVVVPLLDKAGFATEPRFSTDLEFGSIEEVNERKNSTQIQSILNDIQVKDIDAEYLNVSDTDADKYLNELWDKSKISSAQYDILKQYREDYKDAKSGKLKANVPSDKSYMKLAEKYRNGDWDVTPELREMVDAKALESGAIGYYDWVDNGKAEYKPIRLYHGTPEFGFTKFKTDAIFMSDAEYVASTYSDSYTREIESESDDLGGNYELYLMNGNYLRVDAQGMNWNQIPYEIEGEFRDNYTTRQIAGYASYLGYDGVIFTHIIDQAKSLSNDAEDDIPHTVYAIFDKSKVHSADLVTYSNGSIIPLSERFSNADDIRYSTDLDSAFITEERLDSLIEDSGAGKRTDYAQKWISTINPSDFIKLTTGKFERDNFDDIPGDRGKTVKEFNYIDALKNDKRITPYLAITKDGQVIGHDGRHRMRALEMNGVTNANVIIQFYDDDGYMIKEMNGYGKPLTNIESVDLKNQVDSKYVTSIKDIIPINESTREEILDKYAGKDAKVKFSTDLDIDEEYQKAYDDGDEEKQQRIIDNVAKANGYVKVVYHGTNKHFTVFDLGKSKEGFHIGTKEQAIDRAALKTGIPKEELKMNGWGYIMPLYINPGNSLYIPMDIDDWAPYHVAELLYDKATMTDSPEWSKDTLRTITLTPEAEDYLKSHTEELIDIQHMLNIDEANGVLAEYLDDMGYQSIEYFNNVEGDKNSHSYLIYDQDRLKSSKPATFDNDDNLIMPSERFDSSNPDIRWSTDLITEMKGLRKDNDQLRRDRSYYIRINQKLTKELAEANHEMTITRNPHYTLASATELAKNIIDTYQSKLDPSTIDKKMLDLANQILYPKKTNKNFEQDNWYLIQDKAYDIANDIVENSLAIYSGDVEQYRNMYYNIKQMKFNITDETKNEFNSKGKNGYDTWKRKNQGYITFSKNGEDVNDIYQGLSEQYGTELFPEDPEANETEKVERIVAVLREIRPIFNNPFSMDMAEARDAVATDILSSIIYGDGFEFEAPTKADTLVQKERDKANAKIDALKQRNDDKVSRLKAKGKEKESQLRADRDEKLQNQAEKYRERIAKLRQEKNEKYNEMVKASRERYNNKVKQMRQEKKDAIKELKEHYKEIALRKREKKLERLSQERLLNLVRKVKKLKTTEEFKNQINNIIFDIDDVGIKMLDKTAWKLADLRDEYMRRKAADPTGFIEIPSVEEKFARLGKRQIADMDQDEIEMLTEILSNLYTNIMNEKRLLESQAIADRYEAMRYTLSDIKNAPTPKLLGVSNFFANEMYNPVRFVHRIVGYNNDDPLYILTKEAFEGGRIAESNFMRMAEDQYFSKFTNNKKLVESTRGKKAEIIKDIVGHRPDFKVTITKDDKAIIYDFNTDAEVTFADYEEMMAELSKVYSGDEDINKLKQEIDEWYASDSSSPFVKKTDVVVPMTRGTMILLRAMAEDTDAARHIEGGGVSLPGTEPLMKGDFVKAVRQPTMNVTFTRAELRALDSRLTADEKALIKAMFDYSYYFARPQINEVSEKLVGYPIANQPHTYVSIHTDPTYFTYEMSPDQQARGQKNITYGWLNERVESTKPIKITDIWDQISRTEKENAKYVGMAIPLRNLNKLIGTADTDYSNNIIRAIINQWQDDASANYIFTAVNDLVANRSNGDNAVKIYKQLISNYSGAVLSFNAGVALTQTASYAMALPIVGEKALAKALASTKVKKFAMEKGIISQTYVPDVDKFIVDKYSPLQHNRRQGFSSIEMGDLTISHNGKKPNPYINWNQFTDILTTDTLWKACEYKVQEDHKDLTPGTDAYYKKVGELHSQVLIQTQPMFDNAFRGGILRANDSGVKTLFGMFKTELFQQYGLIGDALGEARASAIHAKNAISEEEKAKYTAQAKTASKKASSAIVGAIISAATIAMIRLGRDVVRGKLVGKSDEEKEKYVTDSLLKNAISSILGMVMGGDIIDSFVNKFVFDEKYYGPSNPVGDLLEDFYYLLNNLDKAIENGVDLSTEDGQDTALDITSDAISLVGSVVGIPASNLIKIATVVKNILTGYK